MILLQSLKIELSLRNSRQWMHLGTHSPSLPAPPPLAFGLCVPSALLFVYLLLISPCYHFPMMRGTCFISASSSSFLTGFSLLCECFFLVPLQYISFPFSSFCSLFIFWLLLLPPSSYYFSYYHSLKTTNWKGNIFIRIYCTYHMCSIFFYLLTGDLSIFFCCCLIKVNTWIICFCMCPSADCFLRYPVALEENSFSKPKTLHTRLPGR